MLKELYSTEITNKETSSHGLGFTSRQHALTFATAASPLAPSIPGVAVPLAVVQSSPTPLPYKGKAIVIESDETSAEGPISKRPKPTPAMTSHSSSTGRSVSPLDHMTGVPPLPDLGGTSAFETPHVLELPFVLQHTLKGFQKGVTVDLDEAAARERLGLKRARYKHPRWLH